MELDDFERGKVDQITIYRKKPKCNDVRCKILPFEANSEKRENKENEPPLSDQDKKELEIVRSRLAKRNSRR